jgi:hypothetical protein
MLVLHKYCSLSGLFVNDEEEDIKSDIFVPDGLELLNYVKFSTFLDHAGANIIKLFCP